MNKLVKKLSKTFLLLLVLVLGGLVLPTEAKAGLNTDYVELKVTFTTNTAPSTPVIDNFADGAWITDNTPTLQFDLSDPDAGDIINYQIQIDDTANFGSTVVDYTEPSGSASPRANVQYTPSALDDGSAYYWRVKAIDDDLEESAWATANSGAIAFKVDATDPVTFTPTADPSSWNVDTTPTITFSTTDATSSIDHYEVKIGVGGSYTTQTSPYTLPVQADGQQTVYVKAIDTVGNEREQNVDIYVDTTDPVTFTPTADPSSWNIDTTPTITFSTTDVTSSIDHYEVKIDVGGSYATQTSPYTLPVQADGQQTVYVKAIDTADNEREQTVDIYVDATPPVSGSISIDSDAIYTTITSVTLTLSATDTTSDLSQMIISENSDFSGANWESYITAKTFTLSSADGEKTVYIKFKDNAGNQSTSYSDSITLDSAAPSGVVSINSNADYTTSLSSTLTISTTDVTSEVAQMMVSENSDFSGAAWETYSTSKSYTLSSGDNTKTVYIKFKDNADNESIAYSDTIIYDATPPASFALDSPGHESYTNSERPTFKWKVASTPDATSGLSKYKLEIDNGDSGDFSIDDIPTSRTTDYETNKYVTRYENFSDSDNTNNYILVYTQSTSDWGSDPNSGNNDGKIKEGKRSWKVIAYDNAGNTKEESRTLFVDKSGPSVEMTQINDASFADNLATTDKTPIIYGKVTDSLAGDKTDNKVASGPKEVEIKFEKRNYLGVYSLHTLATVNIDEFYWSNDGSKITDNSKNTGNKYSSFSYTPTTDLPLGIYKITLTGKDKADNGGSTSSFTLTVKTFEEIVQILEVEKIIEELEKEAKVPKEKIKEIIKEQGIVVPEELQKPSVITEGIGKIFTGITNLWWKTVDIGKFLAGKISQGLAEVTTQRTTKLVTAWQTSRGLIRQSVSEENQTLVTRLQIAASTFVAIVFDKEPTRISDVRVKEVTPTSTTIVWRTNHYATSKINYGFSTTYGKEVYSSQRVKEHRFVLKDLEPGKLYYFEVMSQSKNYAYDAYYTFTTPGKENEKVKGATSGEALATIAGDDGNWVLIRDAPSLKGEVLAKVAVGQSFPLLEEKDGWVKIKLYGQEGWVFGELIKIF